MADHSYSSSTAKVNKDLTGPQCYAINCVNYKNKAAREQRITFHKFPNKEKDPERFDLWVQNCCREGTPSKYALVCSKHFDEKWMDRTGQIVRLRAEAVPTIFNVPAHLKSRIKYNTASNAKRISDVGMNAGDVPNEIGDKDKPLSINCVANDHNYDAGHPDVLKRKLFDMEERIRMLEKKARNAQTRENRAKKMCKTYMKEVEQLNLLTAKLEQKHT